MSTAIGRAALILTTDSSAVRSGLQNFKGEATRVAGETARSVRSAGSTFSGGAFLGGLAGGAAGALLAPQIGKAVQVVTEGFNAWYTNAAKVRQELEKSAEALGRAAREAERAMARTDEWLGAITDPKKKIGALGSEIANIESRLDAERQLQESLRKRFLELDEIGWKHVGNAMQGTLDEKRNKIKQELDATTAAVAKFEDRVAGLRESRRRLSDPSSDPALVGEINKATAALKLQADTWGMTAGQAQLAAFRMRGATAAQLQDLQQWADRLDELQKEKAAKPVPMKLDNPALIQGTTAEVSARVRHEFGGKTAADRMLEEQRRANKHLGGIDGGVKKLAARVGLELFAV